MGGGRRMTTQKPVGEPLVEDAAQSPVLVPMEKYSAEKKTKITIGVVYALLVLGGIATGSVLSGKYRVGAKGIGAKTQIIQTGNVIGVTDTKTFKDSAEGVIEKDGVDGEGTHRLIREGGPSQTAFLISSVIDLDQYVGKKVKVWGETFAAQKASWLMDVGKIELLKE